MPKDVHVQNTGLRIEFTAFTEDLTRNERLVIGGLLQDIAANSQQRIKKITVYGISADREPKFTGHRYTASLFTTAETREPALVRLVCQGDGVKLIEASEAGWHIAKPTMPRASRVKPH